MSGRYGGVIAALGGLILALAVVGHGDANPGQQTQNPATKPQQRTAHVTAAYSLPKCPAAKDADEANYCAQRKAAAASEEQAKWALGQFVVGIVGLIGLAATVVFAGLAWRAAHRSATVSERALTELERPFVIGKAIAHGFTRKPHHADLGEVEIQVLNIGRTPAVLTRIEYVVGVAPSGSIIDPIDARAVGGRELPDGIFSANLDAYSERKKLALEFWDERDDLAELKASLWVTGFIRYDSIFGVHYLCGFTLFYDFLSARFVRRGGAAYNYRREEGAKEIPAPSSAS